MLSLAFSVPGIDRVVASTMAVSTGSRRVLEKLGMEHVSTWHVEFDDPIPGTEHGEVLYELQRHAFSWPIAAYSARIV